MFHKHKILFSHKILVLLLLIYGIDFLTHGFISSKAGLNPFLIFEKHEFWRLFTFPLSYFSLSNVLLLVLSVIYICPLIEGHIFRNIFPILTALIILLYGIVFVLFFWQKNIFVGGNEGMLLFCNFLALFFFYDKKITFLSFYWKVILIVPVFIFFWLIIYILGFAVNNQFEKLNIAFFSMGFGLFSSLLVFFQYRLISKLIQTKSRISNKEITNEDDKYYDVSNFPDGELVQYKLSKNLGINEYENTERSQYEQKYNINFEFSEDKLNEILDKISEFGSESLTQVERKFLEDYSKQLNSK